MKFKLINLFCLFGLLSLPACKSIDVTGTNLREADIQYVKSNSLTKEQVIDRLGSPTITPDYSPNTWYYVYIKTTKTTLTFPSIEEQKILKITFNNVGKVENAVVMDNTHNNNVKTVSHVTPTPGTETSGLQEFVKNIGRFNKPKKKK